MKYRIEKTGRGNEFVGPFLRGLIVGLNESQENLVLQFLETAFEAGQAEKAREIRQVLGA